MTFHAVCADCDDFEEVGDFEDVYPDARDHQRDTDHEVAAGRVEA
jgi:hypothetical protein